MGKGSAFLSPGREFLGSIPSVWLWVSGFLIHVPGTCWLLNTFLLIPPSLVLPHCPPKSRDDDLGIVGLSVEKLGKEEKNVAKDTPRVICLGGQRCWGDVLGTVSMSLWRVQEARHIL